MNLLEKLKEIPIINDHTHVFGIGEPKFENAAGVGSPFTAEGLMAGVRRGWNETAVLAAMDDPDRLDRVWQELGEGRRTTFWARAMTRFYQQVFGFEHDEITAENAGPLAERMNAEVPRDTDAFYEYLGRLSNCEVWFSNTGGWNTADPRVTRGKFRWLPVLRTTAKDLDEAATRYGLERPTSLEGMRAAIVKWVEEAKASGAIALKGGAFAYAVHRPFAPDIRSLKEAPAAKARIDAGKGDEKDEWIVQDAGTILGAEVGGEFGLPVQIHVAPLWTARGPTRLCEIMDLTPLFYACPNTTFIVLHGAYPRTEDLADVTATMSNVRAELNWVAFLAGLDYPNLLGKWIDGMPNDRILYGTDGGGLYCALHDMLTREALAEALELRIRKGFLSERIALEIAAKILRNNAIDTYRMDLPKFSFS